MPATVELRRNTEQEKPNIPPLDSLLEVPLPKGDADHRHWSPLQKLAVVANEMAVLPAAPDEKTREKKILDQIPELKLIFYQLRAESTNGKIPTFQVFALFALMCDQVAKLSPRANRGQLYAMAENAVAKSSNGYHAPLALLGAEMALSAAEYCHDEDIRLIAADPDNTLAKSLLQEDHELDSKQKSNLQGASEKSPAQRKFYGQAGAVDVRVGYLSYVEHYLAEVARLMKDAEKGSKLVFTLSEADKKKLEDIKKRLERIKANKLTSEEFGIGIRKMVGEINLSQQEVIVFCDRIDLTTLSIFNEDDLSKFLSLIGSVPNHELIFQPLADNIRAEQLRRALSDIQKEYSPDKQIAIDSLIAEIEQHGDTRSSADSLIRMADFYVDRMPAEKKTVGKLRKLLEGISKKKETDFSALALSALQSAIAKIKILISEATQDTSHPKPVELEKQLIAAYVRYLNKVNQHSVNLEASAAVVDAGFESTTYDLITRMVNIGESVAASTTNVQDRESAYKSDIDKQEAILLDEGAGDNEKILARLELGKLYGVAGEDPSKIVKLLWCNDFNLREYSRKVQGLSPTAPNAQSVNNPNVKDSRLFYLRTLLAESILAVVKRDYADKPQQPERDREIWDMVNEAILLHPGIVQSARALLLELVRAPDVTK